MTLLEEDNVTLLEEDNVTQSAQLDWAAVSFCCSLLDKNNVN